MYANKALKEMKQLVEQAKKVRDTAEGNGDPLHIIDCPKCIGRAISPKPSEPYHCGHCGWTSKPNGESQ